MNENVVGLEVPMSVVAAVNERHSFQDGTTHSLIKIVPPVKIVIFQPFF